MGEKSILVVDDEDNMRHMLSLILEGEGYTVVSAANGKEALDLAVNRDFDYILLDIRMPVMDGMEFLRRASKKGIASIIIMMSAYGTIDTAVEAMKLGAYDYISKPFKPDEIILTLKKAEERELLKRENTYLKREVLGRYHPKNIIAISQGMQKIMEAVRKVAAHDATVLIEGETGTGKELIARAIHFFSNENEGPFIPVNCGAIPENLLESELFGYVKGAFTGASQTKKGLFEEAETGILFLDEIGDIPKSLQVKLLRVLHDGEIRKVGDTKHKRVKTRVVAATAKKLKKEVEQGRFREDLYYRLNVFKIIIPPLRERREDIPALVELFVRRYGRTPIKVEEDAMRILQRYKWPGNVRELEHAIQRALIIAEGDNITVDDLPIEIRNYVDSSNLSNLIDSTNLSIKKNKVKMEKILIKKALERTKGNHTQAAKLLEISTRALIYKLKEYQIEYP